MSTDRPASSYLQSKSKDTTSSKPSRRSLLKTLPRTRLYTDPTKECRSQH